MQTECATTPVFRRANIGDIVEIHILGNPRPAPIFPANMAWKVIDGKVITYAQRWPTEYAAFKDQKGKHHAE